MTLPIQPLRSNVLVALAPRPKASLVEPGFWRYPERRHIVTLPDRTKKSFTTTEMLELYEKELWALKRKRDEMPRLQFMEEEQRLLGELRKLDQEPRPLRFPKHFPNRGLVSRIGPEVKEVAEGQEVFFNPFAGVSYVVAGIPYRMVGEGEIIAIDEKEDSHARA